MSTLVSIKRFFKLEFSGWSWFEIVFFTTALLVVLIGAYCSGDKTLAVISAVCGIIYTTNAGKGKISCYVFGIIGTLCCAYLSFILTLYGNFALHFGYYFPMQVAGFFNWKKNLKKSNNEVIKTNLTKKQKFIMIFIAIVSIFIVYKFFIYLGDKYPLIDSSITVLSMIAMFLAVKRCIEQWVLWTIGNILSILLWYNVFLQGKGVFSIFFVRIFYFMIGIYFYFCWKKALDTKNA